jgi:predicted secreted protein
MQRPDANRDPRATSPSEVELAVGEETTIELPGLGTSGYRWRAVTEDGDDSVVSLSWSLGPVEQDRVVGASATERATFRAQGPGTVTVRFEQARPWERDVAPLNTHRVSVRVRSP